MIHRPNGRKQNAVSVSLSGDHGTTPIEEKMRPNKSCQRRPQNMNTRSQAGLYVGTPKGINAVNI